MSPEIKPAFQLAEAAIHSVLSPIGFKKQKTNWRRQTSQLLHQFTLASMQLGGHYRPEWGLNVISRCENPRPVHWKLAVRWSFVYLVNDNDERMSYWHALQFHTAMPDDRRTELISNLLTKYVVRCLDSFQTEDDVKTMAMNRKHPWRTWDISGLPEEWRTGQGHAKPEG